MNSAYRVHFSSVQFSSTFWEFVSARIMNWNFETVKFTYCPLKRKNRLDKT